MCRQKQNLIYSEDKDEGVGLYIVAVGFFEEAKAELFDAKQKGCMSWFWFDAGFCWSFAETLIELLLRVSMFLRGGL